MSSVQEPLIDFGDNLSEEEVEGASLGPRLSDVVLDPPRQKTRDIRLQTEITPGQMNAALSKGGDAYDVRLDRRVDIVLENNEHIPPTGLFLQVNGYAVLLRPGEKANVPMAFVEVLNNAVQDVPVLDGQQVISYKQQLRFPYRMVLRR